MNKKFILQKDIKNKIDIWINKFPHNKKQSAILGALHIVQDEYLGYLTDDILEQIGIYLEISPIIVKSVASFYYMYDLEPIEKNKIYFCTNISCYLCDVKSLIKYTENKLCIKMGQRKSNHGIVIKEIECLGACVNAPVLLFNKCYYENLTIEKIDMLINKIMNNKSNEKS
jgi:NADH-quinone oxidoreductase subunit E